MKTKCLIIMSFFVCLSTFSQNNVTNNANKEVKKFDAVVTLTDSQKKEIAKIFKDYYQHQENMKTEMIFTQEIVESFSENLKYILTKSQYEKCSKYIKEKQDSMASSLPKSK